MLPPRYSSGRSLTEQYPASIAETWPHEIVYQIITSVYRGQAPRHGPNHMLNKTCCEKAQLGCDPMQPDPRPEYRSVLTDSCYAALRNPGALCSRLLQNTTTKEVNPVCTFWVGGGARPPPPVGGAGARGGGGGAGGPVGWCSLDPAQHSSLSPVLYLPWGTRTGHRETPEASLAHVCPFCLTSSSTSKFHEDVLKASFTLNFLYF